MLVSFAGNAVTSITSDILCMYICMCMYVRIMYVYMLYVCIMYVLLCMHVCTMYVCVYMYVLYTSVRIYMHDVRNVCVQIRTTCVCMYACMYKVVQI